ncbi:hypothetical protein HPP92_000450 [Vanilla planifolia]|uniref:CCR4-NOT transcription complex subunit 10 n=1 Tax=Vanilla planifolia TaxID=51239 RepID=A0A835VKK9_VANPL|nr:hypothetical protein HPP92_000450 [Vanilla planifolia]
MHVIREAYEETTTFSQDKSLYILYNCGLQHLVCGNPSTAAQCFGKASLLFYNKPVLWLQLAECCISAVEKRLLESSGEIKLHVAGSGRWRQLLLKEDISSRRVSRLQSILEDDEQCKLSLPFARRCLKRALVLLDKLEKKGSRATPPNPPLEEETTVTKSIKGSGNKSAFAGDQKTPTAASSFISSVTNCDNKETVEKTT